MSGHPRPPEPHSAKCAYCGESKDSQEFFVIPHPRDGRVFLEGILLSGPLCLECHDGDWKPPP